jgi:hypothetical protein
VFTARDSNFSAVVATGLVCTPSMTRGAIQDDVALARRRVR